jgi:hypothetical protein
MDFNTVNPEFILFSDVRKFKTNDGRYCLTMYGDVNDRKPFQVEFPYNIVAYDVDLTVNRPNVFVYLNDQKLSDFNDKIKDRVVEYVFKNSNNIYGIQKSMEELESSYSNPKKVKKNKKSFSNMLKLKLSVNGVESLARKTRVKLLVDISGIWFSEDTFGPYYDIAKIDTIAAPVKCLIVDTDTDTDNETDFKK